MTVEEYTIEIEQICNELVSDSCVIKQLSPVSHLSKSFIQYTGLIGAIQDYREEKRLKKLMNAPICGTRSFCSYAFHLIEMVQNLVDKQLKVQELITSEDERYFGNAKLIISTIATVHEAWYMYSPDMARVKMTINDINNISLALYVNSYIEEEIRKMALPEGVFRAKPKRQKQDNSGCLGGLLLVLLPIIVLLLI